MDKHTIWSNNSLTCEVMKESNKWKRAACSNYLLKNSKKKYMKAHLETSCSSNLQFLNTVPLLCSGIETSTYTFSNNFQNRRTDSTTKRPLREEEWGALAIIIYLEDLQQLQKVLQTILKHRKRTLLEGYAGISETTILFYVS